MKSKTDYFQVLIKENPTYPAVRRAVGFFCLDSTLLMKNIWPRGYHPKIFQNLISTLSNKLTYSQRNHGLIKSKSIYVSFNYKLFHIMGTWGWKSSFCYQYRIVNQIKRRVCLYESIPFLPFQYIAFTHASLSHSLRHLDYTSKWELKDDTT